MLKKHLWRWSMMETKNAMGYSESCRRCGCSDTLSQIGLCVKCESLVDEEYAMMYDKEESMEIVAE
jgi:hypothetical protein